MIADLSARRGGMRKICLVKNVCIVGKMKMKIIPLASGSKEPRVSFRLVGKRMNNIKMTHGNYVQKSVRHWLNALCFCLRNLDIYIHSVQDAR